jgi:hypothetical protein
MNGEEMLSFTSNTTVSSAYGLQFGRLEQHATYTGTEMIDGVQCHVLQVDDPSAVNLDMGTEAQSMTHYIHADRRVPTRMIMKSTPSTTNRPAALVRHH